MTNFLRRTAIMIHAETGRSVQEILSEIVTALQGGRIPFPVSRCPICASPTHHISSTKTYENEVVRYHSCDFCLGTFVSEQKKEEKKSVKLPQIEKPEVAQKKKKQHIKKRGA